MEVDWPQPNSPQPEHPRADERAYIAGAYQGFHSLLDSWGIYLNAPQVLSFVLDAYKQILDDDDLGVGDLDTFLPKVTASGLPHPFHLLAVRVLATLFHEWHHHLEELTLSELELNGAPAIYEDSRNWYSANWPNAINESLAEADAIDQVLWLLHLDELPPTWARRDCHWRDAQLRRYGLRVEQGSSQAKAVKMSEKDSRGLGGAYANLDQYRRAEPLWGIPGASPARRSGSASQRAARRCRRGRRGRTGRRPRHRQPTSPQTPTPLQPAVGSGGPSPRCQTRAPPPASRGRPANQPGRGHPHSGSPRHRPPHPPR